MNISQNFRSPGRLWSPYQAASPPAAAPPWEDEGLHGSRLLPPPPQHHCGPWVQEWIVFQWVQHLPTWSLQRASRSQVAGMRRERGSRRGSSVFFSLLLKYSCCGLPRWLSGKESSCQAGDAGLISGSGRPPRGRYSSPLQCSYLENPTDRGTWPVTIQGWQSVRYYLATK